jgi:uncharacterized protein YjiS (DUF1127 family)
VPLFALKRGEKIMIGKSKLASVTAVRIASPAFAKSTVPQSGQIWRHLKHHFGEWRRRARSRNELMSLSDTDLQDISVSRYAAYFEASKPFWMA